MNFWHWIGHTYLGRHYAEVEFGYEFFICRVMWDGDGRPFVRICGRHIDLLTNEVGRARTWYPLTFTRTQLGQPQRA